MVELDNKSTSVRMKAAKHPVSEELMVGPGENLFNFMADRLRDFMLEHNLLGEEKEHHLGFTFSFPTVQHSLASADLATWTKGFVCSGVEAATISTNIIRIITTTIIIIIRLGHVDQGPCLSGVEGEDVGALLENAIARYPDMKIKVTWSCISPDV